MAGNQAGRALVVLRDIDPRSRSVLNDYWSDVDGGTLIIRKESER